MVAAAAASMAVAAGAGTVAVVGARGASAGGAGPGLEMLARGGEDCRTLGLKLCPPCVFTMAGLTREKRWRGGEVSKVIWNKRGGGGGGGGGLNRWFRATELSPINIHKYRWLVVMAQKIWKN